MCASRWKEGRFLEAEGEGKRRARGGWRAKEGPDEEGKLRSLQDSGFDPKNWNQHRISVVRNDMVCLAFKIVFLAKV